MKKEDGIVETVNLFVDKRTRRDSDFHSGMLKGQKSRVMHESVECGTHNHPSCIKVSMRGWNRGFTIIPKIVN